MSEFFPSANHPGIFTTKQWVDAWEQAWSDCEAIVGQRRNSEMENCRNRFYTYTHYKLYGIKITTLFCAGVSTVACPSLRSEYFNLGDNTAESFLGFANHFKWDQFYIPDLILDSKEYVKLCSSAYAKNLKVIARDQSVSYAIRLHDNTFSNYLQGLGSNTRLKLFNKRKKLYQIGDIRIDNLWPNFDCFINILNQFHLERWGRACYEGRNLIQITNFLRGIALVGGVPNLSIIYCDDRPVSAVLDLEYRGRIYNIQSGYLEKFQGGISLGTLHFGFQIERAFISGAEYYDFMAGNGKNSDYKKTLATHNATFVSVMIVRGPFLKILYATKDFLNRIVDSDKS